MVYDFGSAWLELSHILNIATDLTHRQVVHLKVVHLAREGKKLG